MKSPVAEKYAKALFAVAKQKATQAAVFAQLNSVVDAFKGVDGAMAFFASPVVSAAGKAETLKKALGSQIDQINPDLLQLLFVLGENDRLGELQNMRESYQRLLNEDQGIKQGHVRTATELDSAALTGLETRVGSILKAKVSLTQSVDPTLLGGVLVQVGGWTFDDSLSSHLYRLSENLING